MNRILRYIKLIFTILIAQPRLVFEIIRKHKINLLKHTITL